MEETKLNLRYLEMKDAFVLSKSLLELETKGQNAHQFRSLGTEIEAARHMKRMLGYFEGQFQSDQCWKSEGGAKSRSK